MKIKLASEHKKVLQSLANGSTLKAHRTLEGEKVYKLHLLDEVEPEIVDPKIAEYLLRYQLIASNMKFPAAVYLLTDQGMALAATWGALTTHPLTTRHYSS